MAEGSTLDAIRVRLGVDISDIESGVTKANQALDKLTKNKVRTVQLRVSSSGDFEKQLKSRIDPLRRTAASGIDIPLKIKVNQSGEFGVPHIRKTIRDSLAQGGGISVPIKIEPTVREARSLRASIQRALDQAGPVKVYFDWVARKGPGDGPQGDGGGAGTRRRGGGGGGGAAGPTATEEPAERQTRAARKEANQAAHRAAQAERAANRQRERAARQEERSARDQQREQQADRTAGTATGTTASGPQARATRQARREANQAATRTAQAETRAARAAPTGGLAGAGTAAPPARPRRVVSIDTLRGGRAEEYDKRDVTRMAYARSDIADERATGVHDAEWSVGPTGTMVPNVRAGKGVRGASRAAPVPPTLNPAMGVRIETAERGRRARDLAAFAARYPGIQGMTPEQRKAFKATLDKSGRRNFQRSYSRLFPSGAIARSPNEEDLSNSDLVAYGMGVAESAAERQVARVNENLGVVNLTGAMEGAAGIRAGGDIRGSRGGTARGRRGNQPLGTRPAGAGSRATPLPMSEASPEDQAAFHAEVQADIAARRRRPRKTKAVPPPPPAYRTDIAYGAPGIGAMPNIRPTHAQLLAGRYQSLKRAAGGAISPFEAASEVAKHLAEREAFPLAEGGLYPRGFGQSFGGGDFENPAKANTYAWKKLRAATIRNQPWCSHCGIGRSEARQTGNPLTADKITSATHGGDPWDPNNLQTLCLSCNSRKSGMSGNPSSLWTHARPRIASHPKLSGIGVGDWLPGGRLFGVASLREALGRMKPKGFAEGGYVKHGGLLGRMAQAGHEPSIRLVGERGPELDVSDPNTGQTEVVPTHMVPTWLQRAQEGHGLTKDLTGHQEGGISFMRGGRFISPPGRAVVNAGGLVNRVFVVNWPAAITAAGMGGMRMPVAPQAAVNIRQLAQAAQPQAADSGGGGGGGGGGRAAGPGVPRLTFGASLARGRLYQRQLQVTQIESEIREAQSLTPARALTTQLSQISSQLFGRTAIQERARQAQKLATQANSALTAETRERTETAKVLLTGRYLQQHKNQLDAKQQQQLADMPELLARQRDRLRRAEATSVARSAAAQEAAGGIIGRGDVVKNIAAGAAGLFAGALIISAGFGAMNKVLGATVDSLGKAAERTLGYRDTAATLAKTLADTTTQQYGNVQAVVAQQNAMTGLNEQTAQAITPALAGRAATIAGNQNLQAQMEAQAAAREYTSGGFLGRPQGLPPGFDVNLVRSTGGLLDLGFGPGAIAPTAEQIQQRLGMINTAPTIGTAGAQAARQQYGPGGAAAYSIGSTIANMVGGIPGLNQIVPGGAAVGQLNDILNTPAGGSIGQKLASDASTDLSKTLKDLNDSADKVDSSFKIISTTDPAAVKATVDAFNSIGATQLAGEVQKKGLAVVGPGGQAVSGLGAASFLQAQVNAANQPSPEEVLAADYSQRALSAQIRATQRQGTYERNAVIPGNVALQYLAHPLLPYGAANLANGAPAGNIPNANLLGKIGQAGFGQQSSEYTAAFAKYATGAKAAQASVTAEIQKGQDALKSWGVPSDLLGQIKTLGTDIQTIQSGIEQKQLNLTVADYNNQLRIANRSLGDAKDLFAGIKGNVRDTLGGLEGQNIALGRQLQLIGFELQQRQINYRLAAAGFTAPGTTPEQRQAAIDEAKIEAQYAQKQLDIQKQMATGGFKINTIEAQRSITDLVAQVSLLTQGRSLAIDTVAAQKAVEAMNAQEDVLIQKAQSYANQGQKQVSILDAAITDVETKTGKVFTTWEDKLVETFSKAGMAYAKAITDAMNPANYPGGGGATGGGGGGGGRGAKLNAPGGVGTFATPTTMTFGEAGTEMVAVIRNPRSLTIPGSGGGGGGGNNYNFSIQIDGASGTDKTTLAHWASQIVREVEVSMARRASMLGLRTG